MGESSAVRRPVNILTAEVHIVNLGKTLPASRKTTPPIWVNGEGKAPFEANSRTVRRRRGRRCRCGGRGSQLIAPDAVGPAAKKSRDMGIGGGLDGINEAEPNVPAATIGSRRWRGSAASPALTGRTGGRSRGRWQQYSPPRFMIPPRRGHVAVRRVREAQEGKGSPVPSSGWVPSRRIRVSTGRSKGRVNSGHDRSRPAGPGECPVAAGTGAIGVVVEARQVPAPGAACCTKVKVGADHRRIGKDSETGSPGRTAGIQVQEPVVARQVPEPHPLAGPGSFLHPHTPTPPSRSVLLLRQFNDWEHRILRGNLLRVRTTLRKRSRA